MQEVLARAAAHLKDICGLAVRRRQAYQVLPAAQKGPAGEVVNPGMEPVILGNGRLGLDWTICGHQHTSARCRLP